MKLESVGVDSVEHTQFTAEPVVPSVDFAYWLPWPSPRPLGQGFLQGQRWALGLVSLAALVMLLHEKGTLGVVCCSLRLFIYLRLK